MSWLWGSTAATAVTDAALNATSRAVPSAIAQQVFNTQHFLLGTPTVPLMTREQLVEFTALFAVVATLCVLVTVAVWSYVSSVCGRWWCSTRARTRVASAITSENGTHRSRSRNRAESNADGVDNNAKTQ